MSAPNKAHPEIAAPLSPGATDPVVPLRDRLIPWYFVGAFLIVLAVNAVFVVVAIRGHSGVSTEHAYQKGLAYNEVIEQAQAQARWGWQSQLSYENNVLSFDLRDADDRPLDGAQVRAMIVRPLGAPHAMEVELLPVISSNRLPDVQSRQAGRYQKEIDFPLKGQWQITIEAIWNSKIYQSSQRLIIR